LSIAFPFESTIFAPISLTHPAHVLFESLTQIELPCAGPVFTAAVAVGTAFAPVAVAVAVAEDLGGGVTTLIAAAATQASDSQDAPTQSRKSSSPALAALISPRFFADRPNAIEQVPTD